MQGAISQIFLSACLHRLTFSEQKIDEITMFGK